MWNQFHLRYPTSLTVWLHSPDRNQLNTHKIVLYIFALKEYVTRLNFKHNYDACCVFIFSPLQKAFYLKLPYLKKKNNVAAGSTGCQESSDYSQLTTASRLLAKQDPALKMNNAEFYWSY